MDKQGLHSAIEVHHGHGVFYRLFARPQLKTLGTASVTLNPLIFICITWLPLLLITLYERTALPGAIHIPFLTDYSSLGRYLIAGPVILMSEPVINPWLKRIIKQFLDCNIIPAESYAKFKELVEQFFRLQNAPQPQLIILATAFITSIISADIAIHAQVATWQTTTVGTERVFSIAGHFQNFFAQPVFRFIWLEAFYQYGLWAYFLFKLSRFPLTIHPTHADGAGGLGFIGAGQTSFTMLAFALSIGLSGAIERLLRINPANITQHWDVLLVWVLFMFVIFLGPLLFFTPMLVRAKRDALFSYGKLSHNVCHCFGKHFTDEECGHIDEGEADLSCDLDHSNIAYQNVSNMRPFVFGKQVVIGFAIACVLPAIPLVLEQMPWSKILEQFRELKQYL